MFRILIFSTVIFLSFFQTFSQDPEPETVVPIREKEPAARVSRPKIEPDEASEAVEDDAQELPRPQGYVRPNSKQRFKNYLNSVAGPYALIKITGTSGITSARNAPKEWGSKWPGFGRRFASNFGKNLIKSTTTYALDEALELDSKYYRSTSKNAGSRFGNAVLSPFTARKRNGKKVLGIPRIAGSFLSGVVVAETWYPKRYDYVHGLKGGVISLGVDVGFNLFKEFVWRKR